MFLEISSLSTYVLIALGPDRRALVAAFQYLIMGTIGATFYVIGIGLLYLLTGTLNMADMAARLAHGLAGPVADRARGPGVRDGRHQPEARAVSAPRLAAERLRLCAVRATAFLAATATKVAIYLLVRFYFSIFGVVDRHPGAAGRRDHHRALARGDVRRLARSRCSRPT